MHASHTHLELNTSLMSQPFFCQRQPFSYLIMTLSNLLPDNLFTRCRAALRVCVTEYSGSRIFNWLNAPSIIQALQAAVSLFRDAIQQHYPNDHIGVRKGTWHLPANKSHTHAASHTKCANRVDLIISQS